MSSVLSYIKEIRKYVLYTNVIQFENAFKLSLSGNFRGQMQVLREHHKGKPLTDDVPLLPIKDFDSHYRQLQYMESSMMSELESTERDAKRPKIS